MPTKEPAATFKIGKIELPIMNSISQYHPQHANQFIDHGEILKTIAIGIRDNLPVLLIGESGCGKTASIRYLAHETGHGLRRVNLNGSTTADELVGRNMIRSDGKGGTETYWVDGVLTEAMRSGDWISFDEINAALPEVLFVLQSVLDDDGYLVLTEKDDKEIVHKHPEFRVFASCNPPSYAGTKEMNGALLSRFPICISAEFPPEKKELDIIEHHLGNAISTSPVAKAMVTLANETRKAKEQGKSEYAINTRDILNSLRLGKYMEPIEALMVAFANKLDGVDTKALKQLARLHLPMGSKKATGKLTKIKTKADIDIKKEYNVDADLKDVYMTIREKTDEELNKLAAAPLATIYNKNTLESAVKEETFVVLGLYEANSIGANLKGKVTGEDYIASLVEFTSGPRLGKIAIMLHMLNTDLILANLSRID